VVDFNQLGFRGTGEMQSKKEIAGLARGATVRNKPAIRYCFY
jgi:hypothetical protein